jgi:hypothetical protein
VGRDLCAEAFVDIQCGAGTLVPADSSHKPLAAGATHSLV